MKHNELTPYQPPTAAIFIATWKTKMTALQKRLTSQNHALAAKSQQLSLEASEMQNNGITVAHVVVDFVLAYKTQLRALQLSKEKTLKQCPDAFVVLDGMQKAQEMADDSCGRFIDMKNGRAKQLFVGAERWQDLPLTMRKRVNELLEKWRQAQADGQWEPANPVCPWKEYGTPKVTMLKGDAEIETYRKLRDAGLAGVYGLGGGS